MQDPSWLMQQGLYAQRNIWSFVMIQIKRFWFLDPLCLGLSVIGSEECHWLAARYAFLQRFVAGRFCF